VERLRLCCSLRPSSDSCFILPPLNAFLTLDIWRSGDTSCSLLAVRKAHVIAYTTGPTMTEKLLGSHCSGFCTFFELSFSLFLSFSICDFPPFENGSFPWISPSWTFFYGAVPFQSPIISSTFFFLLLFLFTKL